MKRDKFLQVGTLPVSRSSAWGGGEALWGPVLAPDRAQGQTPFHSGVTSSLDLLSDEHCFKSVVELGPSDIFTYVAQCGLGVEAHQDVVSVMPEVKAAPNVSQEKRNLRKF